MHGMKTTAPALSGYPRADGRKGIRNVIVVAYLVECAHHVAREITLDFRHLEGDVQVHLVGFPGCFPNSYAERMMTAIATHPNVGAALLVSLGCESMNKRKLEQAIADLAAGGHADHPTARRHAQHHCRGRGLGA